MFMVFFICIVNSSVDYFMVMPSLHFARFCVFSWETLKNMRFVDFSEK